MLSFMHDYIHIHSPFLDNAVGKEFPLVSVGTARSFSWCGGKR